MAVRRESVYKFNKAEVNCNGMKDSNQSCEEIGLLILNFLRTSQNIPKRRYIIAKNQLLSLYRRMKYHPENKALCEGYVDQIKQIIYLERGNKK